MLTSNHPHHPKCPDCKGAGCVNCYGDGLDWSLPHPSDGAHKCDKRGCEFNPLPLPSESLHRCPKRGQAAGR